MTEPACHTAAVKPEDSTPPGQRPIGGLIREARKAASMTQRALAEAVGVDPSAVRAWEAGSFSPSGANLRLTSSILGMDDVLRLDAPAMSSSQIEQALREAAPEHLWAAALRSDAQTVPPPAVVERVLETLDPVELVARAMRAGSASQVVEQVLRVAPKADLIEWALRTADPGEFAAEASRRLARSHHVLPQQELHDTDIVGVPLPSHVEQRNNDL